MLEHHEKVSRLQSRLSQAEERAATATQQVSKYKAEYAVNTAVESEIFKNENKKYYYCCSSHCCRDGCMVQGTDK